MIGAILGGIFGGGAHECVRSAQDNIVGGVIAAFCSRDPRGDCYEVGVIDEDGDKIALYEYDTYGDADHAAGALARHYGVGIRS